MDKQRAQEILDSSSMIDVTYEGSQIYIENVNQHTADVHYINNPNQRLKVSINCLVEQ